MGDERVEVRRAGGTRRLYVGGVLASQWNPRRALTGGYWDALGTAPLLSPRPCATALVLGLGGGAVVHVLRRFAAPRRIVGVEADRRILARSARDFPLRGKDLRVVVGDARAYVATARERFDVVVDDVFEMVSSRAWRPADDRAWFAALAKRVAPGGVLAVNFLDPGSLLAAAPALRAGLRGFRRAFRFDFDGWHNVVLVATRAETSVERYEAAFAGAVPARQARSRGFHLTAFRMR